MSGGAGNDTYVVDNVNDLVLEVLDLGIDTVNASVSYTLGNNVENLIFSGSNALTGIGNTLNNLLIANNVNSNLYGLAGDDILKGGTGNDYLDGGIGNNILEGGAGSDRFGLNAANQGLNTINDFVTGADKLVLSVANFGGGLIANTSVSNDQILIGVGASAATSDIQRFIYNSSTGALYFDADGNGTNSSAFQIAKLNGNAGLSAGDIWSMN